MILIYTGGNLNSEVTRGISLEPKAWGPSRIMKLRYAEDFRSSEDGIRSASPALLSAFPGVDFVWAFGVSGVLDLPLGEGFLVSTLVKVEDFDFGVCVSFSGVTVLPLGDDFLSVLVLVGRFERLALV